MTVLVFKDKITADTELKEIAATPNIEGGIGSVWVWHQPDGTANDIQYCTGADGRCAIAHPWSQVERDWLEAWFNGVAGVQILDALPVDWQYPDV